MLKTIQIFAAGVIGFHAVGIAQARQPPAPVRAVPVVMEPVQDVQRVVGTLRARSRAEIAAREEAAVLEVPVREGQRVEKNEVLARFDPKRINAMLAGVESDRTSALSAIRRREAELERAKTNYDMNLKLYENRSVAQREQLDAVRDLEVAHAQLDEAKHAFDEARSRLDLLKVRLADMEVLAPFSGSIVERHAEAGEWVDPGDPVITMVSDDLEAVLAVPERFAEAVSDHADEISLEITATGRTIQSRSIRKVADIDPRSRTFPLIAQVADEEGLLTSGMSVTACIPAGAMAERLMVPKDALIRTGSGETHVFRVGAGDEGAVAQKVPVGVLFETARRVAVDSSTLRAGELVVVEGNERLIPNRALAVIADDPALTMTGPAESGGE